MLAFLITTLFIQLALCQDYILQSSWRGQEFLDNFEFYQDWDPTFGYIDYVGKEVAEQYRMVNVTENSVAFGVDKVELLDPNANLGRKSIRLESLQTWTHGLFIVDLAHMPENTCAVWPAFWTVGKDSWPIGGEIDIIEFANTDAENLISLHTGEGCSIAGTGQSGSVLTNECGIGGGFSGCTTSADMPLAQGSDFNAQGGGVYAMEWTSTAIRVWFFPRNAIPDSLLEETPDVSKFGIPVANFQGSCDIDTHFKDHRILFNVDLCGAWAGNTYYAAGCPMLGLGPEKSWEACNIYAALNPQAFDETYWEVNYLNVYSLSPDSAPAPSTSLSTVTPAISISSVSTSLTIPVGRTSTRSTPLPETSPPLTGSFTATSSVISVLSSVSTESTAAVTSAPASEPPVIPVPIPTTPTAVPSTFVTSFTSATATSFSLIDTVITSPITTIAPEVPTTAAAPDGITYQTTYVTVVVTVTARLPLDDGSANPTVPLALGPTMDISTIYESAVPANPAIVALTLPPLEEAGILITTTMSKALSRAAPTAVGMTTTMQLSESPNASSSPLPGSAESSSLDSVHPKLDKSTITECPATETPPYPTATPSPALERREVRTASATQPTKSARYPMGPQPRIGCGSLGLPPGALVRVPDPDSGDIFTCAGDATYTARLGMPAQSNGPSFEKRQEFDYTYMPESWPVFSYDPDTTTSEETPLLTERQDTETLFSPNSWPVFSYDPTERFVEWTVDSSERLPSLQETWTTLLSPT